MNDTGICYSTCEEDYSYTELEDAIFYILENNELKVGDEIYVWQGEYSKPAASRFSPDVIEHMEERSYDEFGEYAEDWPNVTAEARKELQSEIDVLIDKWAEKHNAKPTFYQVKETKELRFVITKAAEYAGDFEYKQVEAA